MRVLLLLLLAAPALAAPPPEVAPPFLAKGEPATFDVLGGGSERGAWAMGVTGGWPWSGIRGQVGAGDVTMLVSLNTALGRRWEPMVGIGKRLLDRPRGRLSAELLAGATLQVGTLSDFGPRLEGRLRLMGFLGRVAPYFALGAGHTVFLRPTEQVGLESTSRDVKAEYEWAPTIQGGVAIAITKHVGLDLGLDWIWAGAPFSIALPGIHLGVQFGGGR